MRANVGDTVKFSYKNKVLEGTITRIRIHTRRKLKRAAARLGIANQVETEIEVAEIAVVGRGVYTTPFNYITSIVRSNPEEAQKAKTFVNAMKINNSEIRGERKVQSYNWAKEHGLLPIGPGAAVWVKYKSGLKQEVFLGLNSGYNVKIRTDISDRTVSSKFVAVERKMFASSL